MPGLTNKKHKRHVCVLYHGTLEKHPPFWEQCFGQPALHAEPQSEALSLQFPQVFKAQIPQTSNPNSKYNPTHGTLKPHSSEVHKPKLGRAFSSFKNYGDTWGLHNGLLACLSSNVLQLYRTHEGS